MSYKKILTEVIDFSNGLNCKYDRHVFEFHDYIVGGGDYEIYKSFCRSVYSFCNNQSVFLFGIPRRSFDEFPLSYFDLISPHLSLENQKEIAKKLLILVNNDIFLENYSEEKKFSLQQKNGSSFSYNEFFFISEMIGLCKIDVSMFAFVNEGLIFYPHQDLGFAFIDIYGSNNDSMNLLLNSNGRDMFTYYKVSGFK